MSHTGLLGIDFVRGPSCVEALNKRTPGAPLSDAEHQQRIEAARSRWAQHAAIAAGGAALSAGAAEIVRRSLKADALREAWNTRHKLTQPIREARAAHTARIKAIDTLAAKGRSAIGRPKEKAVGYRHWPVPAYRRMLERQKGRLEQVDLKAAADFNDARAVIDQIEDIEARLEGLKDARPPTIGPRQGYTATREAEGWTARRKLSPQDLLGRMNPLDRESYEIALAEAKAHRLNQLPDPADFVSNWDEITMINRAGEPVLKPKKRRVAVAGNKGATWQVPPTMARRQGSPRDGRLQFMRKELLEELQRRTAKLKTATAERTARIVERLQATRRDAVRQAIARAPKLRLGHVAGLGLLGAALGAGASYALSKADTPRDMPDRRGGGGGDLAANLARVFRGWLENPDAIDPGDLAAATQPIAYAFGEGAEAQNKLFTEAAEGRRKILAGSFGVRNPKVEAAARQHQVKLVGEIAEAQMAAIRQALVDHALRGETPESTARAIRESIGLTPAQAKHVAAYRLELQTGHPGALRRALRDRRFDRTVEKALADKTPLPAEKIDRMVDAYQRRYIAYRAMTIARTETLRAANAGAVASAQAQLDAMPDMTVIKRWVATHDDRTRPDHRELDGKAVLGMDTPFALADGTTIRWPHDPQAPASQTVNCRCSINFELVPRDKAIQRFMAEAV